MTQAGIVPTLMGMGEQESRREKKLRSITHSQEAAERPWSEVLESGQQPPAPQTTPRSAAEELWDEEEKRPEPETDR